MQALITAGADVNAKNSDEYTPLHYARSEHVAKALITAGADVNAKNSDELTPLHLAQSAGIAKALIAAGANVNAKTSSGCTPLISFWLNVRIAGITKVLHCTYMAASKLPARSYKYLLLN